MADEEMNLVLQDLQKQLQNAKIPVGNLSTIAKKGDDALVEKFMGESVFVRGPGEKGDLAEDNEEVLRSQLYIACFWGFRDIVRGMLEVAEQKGLDLDINAQNKGTLWTPLHAATFQEHGPIVKLLLEHDAQPELPDADGRTPKDFASASDKIWGHFSLLGLKKTAKKDLKRMGIIGKIEDDNSYYGGRSPRSPRGLSPREPGQGIKMASYDRPESAYAMNSDPFTAAASGGDVLAGDDGPNANTLQPQLSAYKY